MSASEELRAPLTAAHSDGDGDEKLIRDRFAENDRRGRVSSLHQHNVRRRQMSKSVLTSTSIDHGDISLVEPLVPPSESAMVLNRNVIRFRLWYLVWILTVASVTAVILHFVCKEGKLVDCFFVAINGVTGSGLSTIHISKFSSASQWTVLLSIQLGSFTLASLLPIIIRIHYHRQKLPRHLQPGVFDLSQYRRVPLLLVEYKALLLLRNIVLLYNLGCYLLYFTIILIWTYSSSERQDRVHSVLQREGTTYAATSIPFFVSFVTISAYTNTGFTVTRDSLSAFKDNELFLFCINMLVLHGNVLFPIFLRWIIIGLNGFAEKQSSRKVYFRYLLFRGRDLYHNLFTSQQTWLLLLMQVFAIWVQAILTLLAAYGHHSREERNAAFFTAVNTRHAGFSVYSLQEFKSATLLLIILMMFLAPAPFIAIMESSNKQKDFEYVDNKLARRLRRTVRDRSERAVILEDTTALERNEGSTPTAPSCSTDVRRTTGNVDSEYSNTSGGMSVLSNVYQQSGRALNIQLARTATLHSDHLGPKHWNNEELCVWLESSLGLPEVSRLAREGLLDGGSAAIMDKLDWEELGASKIDSVKIMSAWRTQLRLQEQFEGSDDEEDSADFRLDTRLYLMMKYPDKKVPLRVKVRERLRSIGHGMQHLACRAISPSMLRDVAFLWLMAFMVSLFEDFNGSNNTEYLFKNGTTVKGPTDDEDDADSYVNDTKMFYLMFELVSAFGNVGLSLGSLKNPFSGLAFSAELGAASKVVVMLVEVVGRTRELPRRVDCSLSMPSTSDLERFYVDVDDPLMETTHENNRDNSIVISDEPHTRTITKETEPEDGSGTDETAFEDTEIMECGSVNGFEEGN